MQCGQKLKLQEPAILDMSSCLPTCPQNVNLPIFESVVNISTWTMPETGKTVKRQAVKREALFKAHLRATLHDRNAELAKNLLIDGGDLGQAEDLGTKLGLRRSPQLFLDFWDESNWGQLRSSPYLVNPPGTSAAFYYIEGEEPMEWILVPTNAR